jgi:hypothetical protein
MSEEEALLDMIERKRPLDSAYFRILVNRLVESHWHALVAHVGKRCFGGDIHAEDIVINIFTKAYEILEQQMAQQLCSPTEDVPIIYSRTQCPRFLGFLKALAKWGPLHEARQAMRYRTTLDKWTRQEQRKAQQYGTLLSSTSGKRMALLSLSATRLDDHTSALWDSVRQLPKREYIVVRLYFQYGPDRLYLSEFTELVTSAGFTALEVRTLQKRFRRMLRAQQAESLSNLTQECIAEIFDVNRETIRRLLVHARQLLRAVLSDDSENDTVSTRLTSLS